MNARVLAQTKPSATSAPPVRSNLLQRKCACGGTLGPTGECEECRRKRAARECWQRKVAQPSTLNPVKGRGPNGALRPQHSEVPPIVHEVLRSPGQPLDAETRAFMEPRFGHDFSNVRVHADARAAESARTVNALAYTVGRDVVFGTSQYVPKSPIAQTLIAHELAHVLQQDSAPIGDLSLAPSNSAPEEVANRVASNVVGGRPSGVQRLATATGARQQLQRQLIPVKGSPVPLAGPYYPAWPPPPPPPPPPQPQWLLSGNAATAISPTARLGRLAEQVGAHFNDWKCIKPLAMRTLDAPTANESQKENYHRFVEKGDTFDFSNLTAQSGPALSLYLFADGKSDAEIAKRFYPASAATDDADFAIQKGSNYGSAPIHDFLLVGHASGGGYMYGTFGGGNKFEPSSKSSEEPQVYYDEAKKGHFPRRCRFTRNAVTRLVGCDSDTVAQNFAHTYLRVGANVTTTTRAIRTVCHGQPLGTPCEHPNALEFVQFVPPLSLRTVGGPFGTVGDFQAAPFWTMLPGSL